MNSLDNGYINLKFGNGFWKEYGFESGTGSFILKNDLIEISSFELKNKDQLKAKDDSGKEYIFSKKEFRVQLERLEDYISFELNSGKINHIRYIDFRYNNAIAVYHS